MARSSLWLLLWCLLACSRAAPDNGRDVRVGLLLPYTGKDGASGANFERGVLMATELINASGGLDQRRLRIVYADTHSSVMRGLAGAERLLAQDVVAIIGPEDDELARTLSPRLAAEGVVLLTPSSSSVPDTALELWFRLAPSGAELGNALGRHMRMRGAARVAVVHTDVEYEASFAAGAAQRLLDTGAEIVASDVIDTDAADFTRTIRAIVAQAPDSVVLAADVHTGSRFVNDFGFVAGAMDMAWYLSPSLESEGFVLNTLPDAVEGMVGVAPAVSPDVERIAAFRQAFRKHWSGAEPTTGAFYYYDALALFALAFERATRADQDATPSADALREAMLSASGQSGLVVGWNEIARGIDKASLGQAVYYAGLTGVISLDASGTRSSAYTRFWRIQNGELGAEVSAVTSPQDE